MDIVTRAKNICLAPTSEWPVIAQETTTAGELITGYVAPLAAVGAIAGFIGGSIIGVSLPFIGHYRVPVVAGLGAAVFTFVMAIVGILVLAFIVNALAPTFGGEKNSAQALKVSVYSYTPAWVAGVLQILPALAILAVLAGLYGLYLLYLGLPRLMKCPQEKTLGYTAVVVICAIVLSMVVGRARRPASSARAPWGPARWAARCAAAEPGARCSSTGTARWANSRTSARRWKRQARRWRRPRRAGMPTPRQPRPWKAWAF